MSLHCQDTKKETPNGLKNKTQFTFFALMDEFYFKELHIVTQLNKLYRLCELFEE